MIDVEEGSNIGSESHWSHPDYDQNKGPWAVGKCPKMLNLRVVTSFCNLFGLSWPDLEGKCAKSSFMFRAGVCLLSFNWLSTEDKARKVLSYRCEWASGRTRPRSLLSNASWRALSWPVLRRCAFVCGRSSVTTTCCLLGREAPLTAFNFVMACHEDACLCVYGVERLQRQAAFEAVRTYCLGLLLIWGCMFVCLFVCECASFGHAVHQAQMKTSWLYVVCICVCGSFGYVIACVSFIDS